MHPSSPGVAVLSPLCRVDTPLAQTARRTGYALGRCCGLPGWTPSQSPWFARSSSALDFDIWVWSSSRECWLQRTQCCLPLSAQTDSLGSWATRSTCVNRRRIAARTAPMTTRFEDQLAGTAGGHGVVPRHPRGSRAIPRAGRQLDLRDVVEAEKTMPAVGPPLGRSRGRPSRW